MKKTCTTGALLLGLMLSTTNLFAEETTAKTSPGEQLTIKDPEVLNKARDRFAAQEKALQQEWDMRAKQPGVNQAKLRIEMEGKLKGLRNYYKVNDPRRPYLKQTDAQLRSTHGTKLSSTGGSPDINPGHINADVDLVVQDVATDGPASAAKQRASIDTMVESGKNLQPIENAARMDLDKIEVTAWKPPSPEGAEVSAKDLDAFVTEGGLESTRNPGKIRDELGEYYDNRAKFEKARSTGDMKTMGKSLNKAGNSRGLTQAKVETVQVEGGGTREVIVRESIPAKSNPDLYDGAGKLQKYGTTHEAGITKPGTDKATQQADTQRNVAEMTEEMRSLEAEAKRKGALRQKVRENFADSYDKAGKTGSGQSQQRTTFDPQKGEFVTGKGGDQIRGEIDRVNTSNEKIRSPNPDPNNVDTSKRVDKYSAKDPSVDTYTGGRKAPGDLPDAPFDDATKQAMEAQAKQDLAEYEAKQKAKSGSNKTAADVETKTAALETPAKTADLDAVTGKAPKPKPGLNPKGSSFNPEVHTHTAASRVRDAGGALAKGGRGALETGGKVMAASDILNTGQDVIDYHEGKKTGAEVVGNAAMNFTPAGQAYAVGAQLKGKADGAIGALPAVMEANKSQAAAHANDSGLEARKAGASAEEAHGIRDALRAGDTQKAEAIAQSLRDRGVDYKVPDAPEVYLPEADDTAWERTKEVGAGIGAQVERAGTFVVNAGKNTVEIGSSVGSVIKDEVNVYNRNQENIGQKQGLYERLINKGADPADAQAAVDQWKASGSTEKLSALRQQLNQQPENIELDHGPTQDFVSIEDQILSSDTIALRQAHEKPEVDHSGKIDMADLPDLTDMRDHRGLRTHEEKPDVDYSGKVDLADLPQLTDMRDHRGLRKHEENSTFEKPNVREDFDDLPDHREAYGDSTQDLAALMRDDPTAGSIQVSEDDYVIIDQKNRAPGKIEPTYLADAKYDDERHHGVGEHYIPDVKYPNGPPVGTIPSSSDLVDRERQQGQRYDDQVRTSRRQLDEQQRRDQQELFDTLDLVEADLDREEAARQQQVQGQQQQSQQAAQLEQQQRQQHAQDRATFDEGIAEQTAQHDQVMQEEQQRQDSQEQERERQRQEQAANENGDTNQGAGSGNGSFTPGVANGSPGVNDGTIFGIPPSNTNPTGKTKPRGKKGNACDQFNKRMMSFTSGMQGRLRSAASGDDKGASQRVYNQMNREINGIERFLLQAKNEGCMPEAAYKQNKQAMQQWRNAINSAMRSR